MPDQRGIYSIDSVWSGKFVSQRIIPPDRQNLGNILKENGLKLYDEFKLLQLSEGRCAQDEHYLVRIPEKEILPEIRERLEKKVLDVMALSSFRLLVFFKDGKSGIVDMKTLCAEDEHFGNVLRNESLFRNVHVSPGGNGVEWGEERSVPSETLRESGKEADISYEDVISFINLRLCDTAQVTGILNCSRQYVKQLADKGRMVPIREAGNSDLYRRSALEAEG